MRNSTIDTESIHEKVKIVPALSPGASRLLALMGDDTQGAAEIGTAIASDSGLTVNILKVVNSASFGLSRQFETVSDAAAYLGASKIVGIALAGASSETFNAHLKGYEGTRGDLGRHCLFAAVAARELSKFSTVGVNDGLAFTAGLLHDIGKAVISDFLVGSAAEFLQQLDAENIPDYRTAEVKMLGTDHCQVGCALADHWNIPDKLKAAIAYHHNPGDAPYESKPLAYVVHLADMLAMMQGFGTGADALQYSIDADYTEFVEVVPEKLESLVITIQSDFKNTAAALFDDPREKEE